MIRKCKPDKFLVVKTVNNYTRNVPQILLIVPKLILLLGKNLTAKYALRAVLTEESVENISNFIIQPEGRPDFCLSYLNGPTSLTDSPQRPPLEGSSQPATRRACLQILLDSNFLENASTLISWISQSTSIAKATTVPRLTRQKLYTNHEVPEQVINDCDFELDDYSDEEINGLFGNEDDYQLQLDVQGENDFESSSLDDDEPKVSSHSTATLDPKNAKIVTWHKKEFDQTDVAWLHDTSTRDIYLSESAESPLVLFQKFFTDELCWLLAEQTNIPFMTKTGRASDVMKEEKKKLLGINIIMGNLKFPRLRTYWQSKYCVPISVKPWHDLGSCSLMPTLLQQVARSLWTTSINIRKYILS